MKIFLLWLSNGGRLGFKKFSRPSYIIVTVTESHMFFAVDMFTNLHLFSQWSCPHEAVKGVSNPVKKLIVCYLEATMQLVVLITDSQFKVHCAFICRIINITVFINILCSNICNISISIPNKVAIEKVNYRRLQFHDLAWSSPGSHDSFSSLLSSRLESTSRNSSFHEKTLKNHAHFFFVHDPKSMDEWGCRPSLCT